jgi:hypothetical protein
VTTDMAEARVMARQTLDSELAGEGVWRNRAKDLAQALIDVLDGGGPKLLTLPAPDNTVELGAELAKAHDRVRELDQQLALEREGRQEEVAIAHETNATMKENYETEIARLKADLEAAKKPRNRVAAVVEDMDEGEEGLD